VLAPFERAATRQRRRFKPLTTWARQLILRVHRWAPERRLVVVGDRAYAVLELLDAVRAVATVVTRLRLDAQLFTPPPPRTPGQKGRPRLVGDRLPNLTVHAEDAAAAWTRLTIARWYGEQNRPIEALSQTAVWYSTGFPPVPIRWVLINDPLQRFPTQALLCTDSTPIRSRSSAGSTCAGRWKSPSTRCGPSWASRRSASGRSGQSCARRLR